MIPRCYTLFGAHLISFHKRAFEEDAVDGEGIDKRKGDWKRAKIAK
jgi:hypothetical protein